MILRNKSFGFLGKLREDKAGRPVIRPALSPVDWLLEGLALAGLLAMAGYVLYHYPKLPDTIPSHFNAAGQVDDYASRNTIWFLPVLAVFIQLLLTFVAFIPHQFNYMVRITAANAEKQYTLALTFIRYLKMVIQWLFFFITWGIVTSAAGGSAGLGLWFLPVFLGVIFLPMILYFIASGRHR